MSRTRAKARAEREATAARQAANAQVQRERAVAARTRKDKHDLLWRRLRLWQHGASFRRHKEAWATLATIVLVVLLLTYLFTSSVGALILVGLVLLIASPALAMLLFDRSGK